MEDVLVVEDVDGPESDLTLSVRKLASQLNQPLLQKKVCACMYVGEREAVFASITDAVCSLREM